MNRWISKRAAERWAANKPSFDDLVGRVKQLEEDVHGSKAPGPRPKVRKTNHELDCRCNDCLTDDVEDAAACEGADGVGYPSPFDTMRLGAVAAALLKIRREQRTS